MHTTITPYLTFNGQCKEAMSFYHECLGGKLFLQTIADSNTKGRKDKRLKDYIVHASLSTGHFNLLGSDIVESEELVKGNSVCISIQSSDKKLINKYFKNLSLDSIYINPIKKTHWGTYFGSIQDKYGNQWLFTYNAKLNK